MHLLDQIKKLVAEERRITTELLKLLMRVEEERLFARMGYSSLFEFCVKELKYSEGAAGRRVGAMRLMRRHEAVEPKILTGQLSLTAANQLHGAFKRSDMPLEEKEKLIEAVESLPAREVEKAITAILPEAKIPRKELRALNQSESLLRLVIDDELLKKLDLIKSLYSHRKPGMTYRDLIEMLANDVLKVKTHRNSGAGESVRHIPPALKQKIRERDGDRCTYVDPLSKRRCESAHLLEFDHIRPVAFGGRATEENLRILCRTHNQLAARDQGLLRPSPNTS